MKGLWNDTWSSGANSIDLACVWILGESPPRHGHGYSPYNRVSQKLEIMHFHRNLRVLQTHLIFLVYILNNQRCKWREPKPGKDKLQENQTRCRNSNNINKNKRLI